MATDFDRTEPARITPASILERTLSKPSSAWTEHDLAQAFITLDLRQVALMHVGGDGTLKALDFAPRSHDHFLSIVRYGERADGSSLFPGTGIVAGASDIVLKPRVETAFVDPFSSEGTLAIMCGHATRTGDPLPQSADTVVRGAAAAVRRALGIELCALGEVEYFLGHADHVAVEDTAEERGYHAMAPFVFGHDLRRRALALLAEMGVSVKYAHSEVGLAAAHEESGMSWEQHEIELALEPLARAADNVLLTQWVLRNLAHEQNLHLSFDPVVKRGHAGSGMHFHMALRKGDEFLSVRQADGEFRPEAQALMAALLEHGAALMAYGNRKPSSFVRLFQGKESPTAITWGSFNRKALVRLPITTRDEAGRSVSTETIEFRLPDGSALPHLLLAGVAQVMTAAASWTNRPEIVSRTAADAQVSGGASKLPQNGGQVAEALERVRPILEAGGIFPVAMIDADLSRLKMPEIS